MSTLWTVHQFTVTFIADKMSLRTLYSIMIFKTLMYRTFSIYVQSVPYYIMVDSCGVLSRFRYMCRAYPIILRLIHVVYCPVLCRASPIILRLIHVVYCPVLCRASPIILRLIHVVYCPVLYYMVCMCITVS